MGNSDRLGVGNQQLCPSGLQPKPSNDKLTYRLFPTSNQQPQVSPKTLQQQTLQRSNSTSFKKRRSVSLDEASRPHGVARMPFARPGDAPVPRLQAVPANRVKVTKPQTQDRTSQAPKILSYKPRVSEDGSHGRSSSAPDSMRGEPRARKPTGLAHITSAALHSSARAIRGNGGTWYNPHDSTIGGPKRENTRSKNDRRAQLEKPLPPPPEERELKGSLDPSYHTRSQSTPLSPSPHSTFYTGARSDSVTELTPLVTPSSLDPNRKSYFPLSKDAQMRKLMGMSADDDAHNEPLPFHTRGKSSLGKVLEAPITLPSSRYQMPVGIPAISVNTDSVDKDAASTSYTESPETTRSVTEITATDNLARPSLPSPTFSQASSRMKPAALRITSPQRSASVNSIADRRPLPLQARLNAANDFQSFQPSMRATEPKEDETAKTLSILSELTSQTDALHGRYASLREDRQRVLASISQDMRETKPGPEYVNTILDQHMSLTTICSSMDICLAKLKAVSRRKDGLIQTLATQAPTSTKTQLPSIEERRFASESISARSTPAMSHSQKMATPKPAHLQPQSARDFGKSEYPNAMQRFQSRLDVDYDTDDSEAPRRMNIKGAKAAKILGLAIEGTKESGTQLSDFSTSRPTQTFKQNLSTTSLDRDLFTRDPSPAPERPLPARPSIRRKQRDNIPAPLPLKPVEKAVVQKVSHNAQDSVGDSTISSRASSPAAERGAETPLEEYPAFDDAKSPGMQTVHVYFPDSASHEPSLHSSTFSEVGEDELLEYYRYLR